MASLISNYGNAVPVVQNLAPYGLDGTRYQMINGQLISMADNGVTYIKDGYNINDILYSLVTIQKDKIKVAPWSLFEIKDASSLKKRDALYRTKNASVTKILDLNRKALEPINENKGGRWAELLKYPNDYQTFNDFIAYGCGYKMLNGNKYIWGDILPGGKNAGKPNSLNVMPSQYVSIYIERSNRWPSKVIGYSLTIFPNQNFKVEEIMHEKTDNYECDVNGNYLYGMSPVKPMLMRLNQSNSLLKTNTAKVQNGGVEALIFAKNQPPQFMKEADAAMSAIKGKLIHEYTGPDNWGKIVAANLELGVEKLGMNPVELDVYRASLADMRFMCNIYGVPSQLLNDPDNKAHNNVTEAEKALTTRCAIPQLVSARDNINRWAHMYGGLPGNWIVDFDITAYPELQDDMGATATWIEKTAKLAAYSPNEVRSFMGVETIPDPKFDEPRIHQETGTAASEDEINIVDESLSEDAE